MKTIDKQIQSDLKNVYLILQEKQQRVSKLITDKKVFFAFSKDQFAKNKTKLAEGDTYVSIGHGGYMPNSLYKEFITELDSIDEDFYKRLEPYKEAHVLYELQDHESFYCGNIDDVVDILNYPKEYISEIYLKYA